MNNDYFELKFVMKRLLFLLFVFLLTSSCQNRDAAEKYKGTLTIYAGETQRGFLNQFIPIFENVHPNSKLKFEYLDEQKLKELYFADSIDNMMLSNDLSKDELLYANQNRASISKQYYYADDAIAIIGNKQNMDSVFTMKTTATYVVMPSTKNKVQSILKNNIDSSKLYALKTALEVIEYVEVNPNAIGFIPFSTFSNYRDSKHKNLKERIKVLDYKQKDTIYKLSQSSIYDFSYPLVMHKVLVTPKYPEPFLKLFASFLFKDRTSKAILHYGLVSAKVPELEVVLKEESYKVVP